MAIRNLVAAGFFDRISSFAVFYGEIEHRIIYMIIPIILLFSLILLLTIILFYLLSRNRRFRFNFREVSDEASVLTRALVHELRNPLHTLKLNIQMLEEEIGGLEISGRREIKDELLGLCRSNRREIKRLDETLSELLRYTRPAQFSFTQEDINRVVKEIIKFFEIDLEQKGIRLVQDLSPQPLIGMIDERQFKQALFNLVLNAIQAMPQGGNLTIATTKIDTDNDPAMRRISGNQRQYPRKSALIYIGDTGGGMGEERDKIFDLFYSTKPGGIGLGLPIVKRIIEGHQGQITFESQKGKGSTFKIYLPLT